jgi:hypothetical protein
MILTYYTYETMRLREISVESVRVAAGSVRVAESTLLESFRPVVIGVPNTKVAFRNVGSGPAMNPLVLYWDGKTAQIPHDREFPSLMEQQQVYWFQNFTSVDITVLCLRFPDYAEVIRNFAIPSAPQLLVVYRDLANNTLYSSMDDFREKGFWDLSFKHDRVT